MNINRALLMLFHCFQDNYLIEVKGDVNESQPTSMADESQVTEDGIDIKVYYLVHPSMDGNESSSFQWIFHDFFAVVVCRRLCVLHRYQYRGIFASRQSVMQDGRDGVA